MAVKQQRFVVGDRVRIAHPYKQYAAHAALAGRCGRITEVMSHGTDRLYTEYWVAVDGNRMWNYFDPELELEFGCALLRDDATELSDTGA